MVFLLAIPVDEGDAGEIHQKAPTGTLDIPEWALRQVFSWFGR
jgi:hypothetical protein